MPGYVLFSLTAAGCFAVGGLLNKFASKHTIDNKNSMMVYFMVTLVIVSLILLPFVDN